MNDASNAPGFGRRGLDSRRTFRARQTPAELLLWEIVRDRRLSGLKFRRQHPLYGFVLDFYCSELRLAVELDGPIHDKRIERDQARDALIGRLNIQVVRITNDDLLHQTNDTMAMLAKAVEDRRATISHSETPRHRQMERGRAAGPGVRFSR